MSDLDYGTENVNIINEPDKLLDFINSKGIKYVCRIKPYAF